VTPSAQSTLVWANPTTDVRGLLDTAGGRIAAAWNSDTSFSVNINITDGQTHQVALYMVDWNYHGRSQRIDVLNAAGQVIDSRTVSSFGGGEYLVWNVSGNVTFRFTNLAGPNAALSGIFFDAPG
jgi:alpha-L-rhamnosidase